MPWQAAILVRQAGFGCGFNRSFVNMSLGSTLRYNSLLADLDYKPNHTDWIVMKIVFLFGYLIFLVIFFCGAWKYARRKRQEVKKLRNPSPIQGFLFSDLPKDWYVSVALCAGLAIAAFMGLGAYKTVFGP
jgi:hypothetical protein